MKQQLMVLNRSRQRAPNFSALDRLLFGFWSLLLGPRRIPRVAVIIKPSTLLGFHEALRKRKYRLLYASRRQRKPGPKGPSQEMIELIVELKRRNSRFGCARLALIVTRTFGIEIAKDVVRRVLAKHYRPDSGDGGPSWLTLIGHMKDSLWSVDLFRCESILLKTHWVLAVMDQFTRRIVGFGVHAGEVDGIAVCRMFNHIIAGKGTPKRLSSDRDLLFEYHRWKANLRILDVEEIRTVPYTPLSHPPFIERLIGTVRREYLDHVIFWNAADLQRKLTEFQHYYNEHRVHSSLEGKTPLDVGGLTDPRRDKLGNFRWESHCRGLYELPLAA